MAEERLIYFDADEIPERASVMDSVKGLEAPDEAFYKSHMPMAALRIEEPETGGPMMIFFTVTVPGGEEDGLPEELWSNALLNSASLILEDELKEEAEKRGLVLSEQRGPGLGGLPHELAAAIVERTGADRIGVSVNDQMVMSPPFTRCGYYIAAQPGSESPDGCEAGCGSCLGKAQGCVLCMRNKNLL